MRRANRHWLTRKRAGCSLHFVEGRRRVTSCCVHRRGLRGRRDARKTLTPIDEQQRCDHGEECRIHAYEEAEQPIRFVVHHPERFLAVATPESGPEPSDVRVTRVRDAPSHVEALAVGASPAHQVSRRSAFHASDEQSSCAQDRTSHRPDVSTPSFAEPDSPGGGGGARSRPRIENGKIANFPGREEHGRHPEKLSNRTPQ